jgi:hypothetical protein
MTPSGQKRRAPKGLTPETRRWFVSVVSDYVLEPHHVRLLGVAARAFDESEKAAALVLSDGLLITMPSGAKRPHPALRIANEARAVYMRAIRELDLDLDAPPAAVQPPALRSIVGGRRHAS